MFKTYYSNELLYTKLTGINYDINIHQLMGTNSAFGYFIAMLYVYLG